MSPTITPAAFLKDELPTQRGQVRKIDGTNRYGDRPPAYYNEAFAKGLLPTLLDMIRTRQDKEILRDRVSTDTCYQRVHQAFAYAVDHLDSGGVLEKLRQETKLRRTPRGIVICFLENASRYDRQAHVHNVARMDAFKVRDAISVNWRLEVNTFIEDTDRKELRLVDGFALTPQEQNELRALVALVPPDVEPIHVVKLDGFTIHLKRKSV